MGCSFPRLRKCNKHYLMYMCFIKKPLVCIRHCCTRFGSLWLGVDRVYPQNQNILTSTCTCICMRYGDGIACDIVWAEADPQANTTTTMCRSLIWQIRSHLHSIVCMCGHNCTNLLSLWLWDQYKNVFHYPANMESNKIKSRDKAVKTIQANKQESLIRKHSPRLTHSVMYIRERPLDFQAGGGGGGVQSGKNISGPEYFV